MHINNSYAPPANKTITSQESRPAHDGPAAGKGPASLAGSDSVTISNAATLVDSSIRVHNLEPAFDMQRVAELKDSIHGGNYVVNPEQVAEKLHQFNMRLH